MKVHVETDTLEVKLATGKQAADTFSGEADEGRTPIVGSIRGTIDPKNIGAVLGMLPSFVAFGKEQEREEPEEMAKIMVDVVGVYNEPLEALNDFRQALEKVFGGETGLSSDGREMHLSYHSEE